MTTDTERLDWLSKNGHRVQYDPYGRLPWAFYEGLRANYSALYLRDAIDKGMAYDGLKAAARERINRST